MAKGMVVVAMSGGVDSCVAAALLKREGYDVVGVTMRLGSAESSESANPKKLGGCCGSRDFFDARAVAQQIGIPHYNVDYRETFKHDVIDYFTESYLRGETPNPCIACNNHVKFDHLLKRALAFGADYLATGHYARVIHEGPGRSRLLKARDTTKDQSYVLYHLGQEELSRILFPLGDYTKDEVRGLAREFGLPVSEKPDSQEICFVENKDYRSFIEKQPQAAGRIQSGLIKDLSGQVLGQHPGLPNYTVGQREGLGLNLGKPQYVVEMDVPTNTLVVGDKKDVHAKQVQVRDVVWTSGQPPVFPVRIRVKIRYKHEAAEATLSSAAELIFDEAQPAMTPGQAAVFYQGDEVIGGSVIQKAVRLEP